MALDLALDTHNTGIVARYWKITSTHLDHLCGQVTVWLHGWTDDAARIACRMPAASLTLTLGEADLGKQNLHAATTATLYAALKSRAEAAAREAGDGFEHAESVAVHSIAHLAGALDC